MTPSYKRVLLLLSWYLPQLHRGIVDYACRHNWFLEMAVPGCFQKSLNRWRGDAVIADCDCGYDALAARGIRVGACAGLAKFDCAVYDETGAIGQLAADYFLQKGYNRFAVCAGEFRRRAFCRIISEHGFDCVPIPISTSMPLTRLQAERLMRQLRSLTPPCAVFCENDWVGGKIFMLAHEAGLRVPEDLAILGVGNDDVLCHSTIIPLSSVESRLYERGYLIAETLDKVLTGIPFERIQSIPPPDQVVERGSTAFYAVQDERVGQMIQCLCAGYKDSAFRIADLAKRFHCAESTLYRNFMQTVGISPKQLLMNIRFENARRLLRDGEDKISVIAAESGFSSASIFYEAFRQMYDTTPEKWRKRYSLGH